MWWTLPSSPLLHDLRAFSIVVSLLVGMIASVSGGLIAPWGSAAGPMVALACGVLLLKAPKRVLPVFRRWNAVARSYEAALTSVTTLISLALVVVPAGIGVGSRDLPGKDSYWRPRGTQTPETYVAQHASSPSPSRPGWTRDYAHWAIRSRNAWALGLMPFLLVLRGTARPSESAVPHDIYTLY